MREQLCRFSKLQKKNNNNNNLIFDRLAPVKNHPKITVIKTVKLSERYHYLIAKLIETHCDHTPNRKNLTVD